jgi:hypothetical protein
VHVFEVQVVVPVVVLLFCPTFRAKDLVGTLSFEPVKCTAKEKEPASVGLPAVVALAPYRGFCE